MSTKQYKTLRIIVAMLIAMIFSQSLIANNFFVPIITLALAMVILLYAKKHVHGVIADERDYEIGGKSALWTMQIFSIIAVVIIFILYALRETNPFFEPIAITLSYAVITLLLLYSLIFNYFGRFKFGNKKSFYSMLIVFAVLALFLGGMRLLSGEDTWVCNHGAWVEHGHPASPAPQTICE